MRPSKTSERARSSREEPSPLRASRSSVLIVDDDRDVTWAVRDLLSEASFGVAKSDGRGAGAEQAARERPTVVLLDFKAGASALRHAARIMS